MDNVSHFYEIKLLYFLLLAAAILQNWADGHGNHFVIAFLSICVESCLRIMVKKTCLFKNRMDLIVLSCWPNFSKNKEGFYFPN